ncbi:MAG: hypothetical protein EU544_05080 [Promethearchaeota archaeon]|nr:MAG: hypothetical protein EU544_05080 [Candidatus Lokiarchaeota archaeon]
MAKKKKEVCPYCGKSFVYLSRHKCKVKEKVEGLEDDKSESERRLERIQETKKAMNRNLRKNEKKILKTINEEGEILFRDLLQKSDVTKTQLENILDVLRLQSQIKVRRELVNAAWTYRIFALEEFQDLEVKESKINKKNKDYVWDLFGRQPCFICPVEDKCNETNPENYNPHHCIWLTEWIDTMLREEKYEINFDELRGDYGEY